jgi:hypothetical protein
VRARSLQGLEATQHGDPISDVEAANGGRERLFLEPLIDGARECRDLLISGMSSNVLGSRALATCRLSFAPAPARGSFGALAPVDRAALRVGLQTKSQRSRNQAVIPVRPGRPTRRSRSAAARDAGAAYIRLTQRFGRSLRRWGRRCQDGCSSSTSSARRVLPARPGRFPTPRRGRVKQEKRPVSTHCSHQSHDEQGQNGRNGSKPHNR